MTDRPINFPAPMIRALLDGRKSQTRRVLKPFAYDRKLRPAMDGYKPPPLDLWQVSTDGPFFRLPYAIGDRLYVREAACWVSAWGWRYRADNDDLTEKRADGEVGKWRPPILMPRWASRLTLTVTDVRVQRLQEISADDAVAEGCYFKRWITGEYPFFDQGVEADNRALVRQYRDLWNSLHGPEAWGANPWVVALSFTVQRGNIDQIGGDA